MLEDDWKRLTAVFPRVLAGARIESGALPPTDERQPPFICGAFSPDESLIALSGGGRIPSRPAIWVAHVPSLETALVLRGHQGVHALAWDPRTCLLASASNDYTSVLWELERKDHVFICGGDNEPIVKGHVVFGGNALYIGETEAFAKLRSRLLRVPLATGRVEVLHTLDGPAGQRAVTALAVDADERWAMGVEDFGRGGPTALVTGQRSTKDANEHELDGSLHAMGFRDGVLVLATSRDDALEIRAGVEVVRVAQRELDLATFSLDGQRLAVAHGNQVRVISTSDGSGVWAAELPSRGDQYRTTVLAWSQSGEPLALAGFGLVAILDARSGAIENSTAPPKWFR